MDGAGVDALPAADTFGTVRRDVGVYHHPAGFFAGAAADAGVRVHTEPDQADLLEQGIECTQRTDVPAEGPVDHDG